MGQLFSLPNPTHSRGSQLLTASTKSLGSSCLVFQKPKLVPAKMPITRRNPRLTNVGTSSLVKVWRSTVLSQITDLKMFRQKWTPSGSGPPLTSFIQKNYSRYQAGVWGLNFYPQHSGSPAHTRTTLLISRTGNGGSETRHATHEESLKNRFVWALQAHMCRRGTKATPLTPRNWNFKEKLVSFLILYACSQTGYDGSSGPVWAS